jgi:hypothetical protein
LSKQCQAHPNHPRLTTKIANNKEKLDGRKTLYRIGGDVALYYRRRSTG